MTPEKQEAIRLINLFSKVGLQTRTEGIECAKICVDELIENVEFYDYKIKKNFEETIDYSDKYFATFWIEVKKAIEQYENLINI